MDQKITPFLWFDNNAEDPVNFYISVFKNGKIKSVSRYSDAGPGPEDTLMAASFELNGQPFIALNGGPQFSFTEAVSFVVHCDSQEEVNYYWDNLSKNGSKSRCGWLKDQFGLSWQIIPRILMRFLQDKDTTKSKRVMLAMLEMDKIEINRLQEAYDGNLSKHVN